jgi:HK97 family phage portal protein
VADLSVFSALRTATLTTKALPRTLSGVDSRGGWWPIIREAVAGNWQSNVTVDIADVLTYAPVYACLWIISSDIAKCRPRLVRQDIHGIWHETENPAFSPVIRKPNRFQTRIQFYRHWVLQKLIHGNVYILKQRDNRNVVQALYVLDTTRVRPLVADDGSVFYQLQNDNLSGLKEAVTVPGDEIIHDSHVTFYHPLVGISPISATGVPAVEALRIQENSVNFFGNGSQPGGVLTAPGHITVETAARVKEKWDSNFTGSNAGKVAVLGDGLKYDPLSQKATDSQLIEQLKWTAEDACTAFGVPRYKIGIGPDPPYNNIEALNLDYYERCLQEKMESIEELLDYGLGLAPDRINGERLGTEFDVNDLFRMDTLGRVTAGKTAIDSGAVSPNESRKRYFDLPPTKGGDAPYMQQQNFSLEALAERDNDKPFAKPTPASPAVPATAVNEDEDEDVDEDKAITEWRQKAAGLLYAS